MSPADALAAGALVASRYEILGTLGAGGMGLVYSAQDRVLDEPVALKVLPPRSASDPGLVQRFRSEAKLARRVRHRNVCGIHEYGEDGDVLFIAMELVAGRDLRRILAATGPLVWEDAYDLLIQATAGLSAIHEAGIVHRDLKPSNMMLDTRGLVRILDFGIARVWSEERRTAITAIGHVVGSPEYMSPEQVRGRPLDARSDLYSLGLVAFEAFSGVVPFRGDTPVSTMLRRLEGPAPLTLPAAARIPTGLLPVLARVLAPDPEQRFSSAEELLQALIRGRAALETDRTEEVPSRAATPAAAATPSPPSPPEPAPPSTTPSRHARFLVPTLTRALQHPDASTRAGAAETLGWIGGEARGALPQLRAVEDDAEPEVRASAARAVRAIEAAEVEPAGRGPRQGALTAPPEP